MKGGATSCYYKTYPRERGESIKEGEIALQIPIDYEKKIVVIESILHKDEF